MVHDEIKSFIDNTSKSYGRGLIPKITQMWSCPNQIRMNFKNMKEEDRIIDNPTLSFLASTTPQWFEIKEDDTIGGFLGRFLIICSMGEESEDKALPPKEDQEKKEKILNHLRFVSELQPTEFTLMPDAEDYYKELYSKNKADFKKLDNSESKKSVQSFYSRVPIHILKLSMLFKIACNKDKIEFVIDKDTLVRANTMMDYIKEHYQYLVSRLTFGKEDKLLRKALDLIIDAPDGYIKSSSFMKILKTSKKDNNQLIDTLEEREDIVIGKLKTTTNPCRILINPNRVDYLKNKFGDDLKIQSNLSQ